MSETKDEIAAERDRLQLENEQLRRQLAAAGAGPRAYAPTQRFQLSEGDRQELAMRGVVNVGGRMMTRDEVAAELESDQLDIDLGEGEPATDVPPLRPRSAIPGVDFVYPSVEPGKIDPAVAGTPGINGPAADTRDTDTPTR
jgi:hypothetical protein